MRFEDTFVSAEYRYSLGVESTSGRRYLAIPVTNGIVDYEEYYELTDADYRRFAADPAAGVEFADQCRRREHDDLLIQSPGANRGIAY